MVQCKEDPTRQCQATDRIEQLAKDLADHKDKSAQSRKEIYERLRELESSSMEIKTHFEYISRILDNLKHDMEELKSKSGKRWDSVTDKVVLVIVGAVVAYILSQVGL